MFGCWPASSVLVSRRLICWFMKYCHGPCVTQSRGALRRLNRLAGRSGAQRREQGLSRAGTLGPRGMIQLAWRFLMFQKKSALALCIAPAPPTGRSGTRQTIDRALARKLIIALWRLSLLVSHWRASSYASDVKRLTGTSIPLSTHSALALAFQHDCRIEIRGGGSVFEPGT